MNARFSDAFLVVFSTSFVHFESFLCIDVPLSSIRCALSINRSNMASASVVSPMDAYHRSVRTVDSLPTVTIDSVHLETLSIRMHTETGIYDFKMDAKTADGLRYLFGRVLDPASEHLVFS